MNNRDQLIDLMIQYQLERREISELLSVDRATVDHWLLPMGSGQKERIPTMAVELLQFKMEKREKARSQIFAKKEDEPALPAFDLI